MTTKTYEHNLGVDISKEKIDVSFNADGVVGFTNNQQGFQQLLKRISKESTRVVMEATGGYEKPLAAFLQTYGIDVSIVNPKRVRDYAKALGKLAKTDTIDAHVIRLFAEAVNPQVMPQKSESQQALDALARRREQLVKQRTMEKQHLETATNPEAKRSIKRMIKQLDQEIERIEKQVNDLIDSNPAYQDTVNRLTTVKGIGPVVALTLIADLPELGQLNHKEISALVGVAPFCRDSGTMKGKRTIWGGRASVRAALYMAAVSAISHNPPIKTFYQRLLQNGKAKKAAIVACMRKLLIVVNSMIKNEADWNPNFGKLA